MANKSQQVKFTLSNPVHFLALGFGSGLIRPAPGTWGTLAGALLLLFIGPWLGTQSPVFLLMCLVMSGVGVYLCGQTARDVGVHDHGAIVWDEIVGIFVTLAFVPFSLPTLIVGFVLFRFFDIVKPWPIGWLDARVHGGLGIMLDDIVAALYAGILLYLTVRFELI
ncbi:MAG: phosphatidylglycerophosphatase A [Arenicella sp.]|jgi:phosphatidylglycerophosphatase A|nr:phosphatidylglycerophosphatase A [Arenicella sp.]HAU69010.1 phosphatidylglycerophosphatase A [Gammaproteobacteria bacterium]